MKKREDFPIEEKEVLKFVESNSEKWNKPCNSRETVYLNFSMVRMQIPWITPKLLYAKGISDKRKIKAEVYTWSGNETLKNYIESFGLVHKNYDELIRNNLIAGVKAFFRVVLFMLFDGNGEGIKNLKYKGISIGYSFYEDILRTSSMSTIRSARNKICFKKLFHLLWLIIALDKKFKKNPPLFFICDDLAYHENSLIKLAKSHSAKIYADSNVAEREVKFDEQGEIIRMPRSDHDQYVRMISGIDKEEAYMWCDKYLEDRFQGKNGRNIDRGAFAGKKIIQRNDVSEEFGIDISKKNVVIMAHTFTDAVFNYGTEYYFKDYYDWMEKTLKIASECDNVNWILKPHPTRSAYNESEDSIEDMFVKYKKSYMCILSDDISAESIKNFADVIVTIGGNAGAEFACFGIPSVIVGKPYYSGFGFTIEPDCFEEYENVLNNLNKIEKLTEEQIGVARRVFYMNYNCEKDTDNRFVYSDEFAKKFNSMYTEMQDAISTKYFQSNDGTIEYNSNSLVELHSYVKEHDLKKTEAYIRGYSK